MRTVKNSIFLRVVQDSNDESVFDDLTLQGGSDKSVSVT